MKRRLAGRDRLAWLIAVLAVGAALYFLVPLWMLVAAVVIAVGIPLLMRHNRRQRRRASRT